MENLKEQTAAILAKYISDAHCQVFHSHDDVFLADLIHTLYMARFKVEVDKLIGIDDEEMKKALGIRATRYGAKVISGAQMLQHKTLLKTQLRHNQKQLLDLMEGIDE